MLPAGHLRMLAALGAALALALPAAARAAPPAGLDRIRHIIVLYMENHSFDNLFGIFPGADGLAAAGRAAVQVDAAGRVYATLPPVVDTYKNPRARDPRFPADLPNRPFPIDRYVPQDEKAPDLVHRYYQERAQIDGGKMDKFAAISDAHALAMGYYDGSKTALWRYAREFTLADHFFHAAFGGSFLNHFWAICACTPVYKDGPAAIRAVLRPDGSLERDGAVTPDGFAVNTIQSVFTPHSARITDKRLLLPPQTAPTIGDRLTAKGVSWAWYSGGWNAALAGRPDRLFQYHHQPFAYFARYGDGTAARREHLKDESDFVAAIDAGTLPAVVFYKPIGSEDEHPGYADLSAGDRHMAAIIERIRRSAAWPSSVIIVTYDENGGYWDHVAPPAGDRWGPGTRVPTVIVSPFAKRHFVDHTVYDTTAILKLIEERYRLEPLGGRDAKAADLSAALDLSGAK